MRADRLLSILLLLQTRGRASARELAEQLEVSERTIYRDIEALSAAGVPVYAERGRGGGCRLLPGYRTNVTGLTAGEAQALFLFGGKGAPGAAEDDLRQALRKLLAGLPAAQRSAAQAAQGSVVVDARPWHRSGDDPPLLAPVQEAVWQGRRVRVAYRSADASGPAMLTVDPYGLLVKSGLWYLIGAARGEPQLFRLSRMDSVEVLAEPATRPARLDLEALWRRLRRRYEDRGEGEAVRLRVRAEQAARLARLVARQLTRPTPDPLPAPDASGWITLELGFVALGAARAVLAGFGADVVVQAPQRLRDDLLALGRELVARYSDPAAAEASRARATRAPRTVANSAVRSM